jgi:hypothetical protein
MKRGLLEGLEVRWSVAWIEILCNSTHKRTWPGRLNRDSNGESGITSCLETERALPGVVVRCSPLQLEGSRCLADSFQGRRNFVNSA